MSLRRATPDDAHADHLAREAGLSYLRVDCCAGGTGRLIEFYESCGYTRLSTFTVGNWPGRVPERRLPAAAQPGVDA